MPICFKSRLLQICFTLKMVIYQTNYLQIQDQNDERSVEARKNFSTMTQSVYATLGLQGSHSEHLANITPVPTDMYNTLSDLLLKVNSVATDIRHAIP